MGIRLFHSHFSGCHWVSKRSGRSSGQSTLWRGWHHSLDLEVELDDVPLLGPDACFDPQQDPQRPVVLLQVPVTVRIRHVQQALFMGSEPLSGHTNWAQPVGLLFSSYLRESEEQTDVRLTPAGGVAIREDPVHALEADGAVEVL